MNKDERRGNPDGVGGILSRDTKRLEYVLDGQPTGCGPPGWYTRQDLMIFALFNQILFSGCVTLDTLKSSFWG